MKTYAEATGHAPFDWAEFLNRNRRTRIMWKGAHHKAEVWPTCACGNLCKAIPRMSINVRYNTENREGPGAPKDGKLFDLGIRFSLAIEKRDIAKARRIFAQIEARSIEILKEMNLL